jgi:hypothetical protein
MTITESDITLRDYFAGLALQGITQGIVRLTLPDEIYDGYAKSAYTFADAMLKERNKL